MQYCHSRQHEHRRTHHSAAEWQCILAEWQFAQPHMVQIPIHRLGTIPIHTTMSRRNRLHATDKQAVRLDQRHAAHIAPHRRKQVHHLAAATAQTQQHGLRVRTQPHHQQDQPNTEHHQRYPLIPHQHAHTVVAIITRQQPRRTALELDERTRADHNAHVQTGPTNPPTRPDRCSDRRRRRSVRPHHSRRPHHHCRRLEQPYHVRFPSKQQHIQQHICIARITHKHTLPSGTAPPSIITLHCIAYIYTCITM